MSMGFVYLYDGRIQPLLSWHYDATEDCVIFGCDSGLYKRVEYTTFDFDSFTWGTAYGYYLFNRERETWNKTSNVRKAVYFG